MMAILATYGFVPNRSSTGLWWGVGSLVWGYTAEVRQVGKNLYRVRYHKWYYDSYGDCVEDSEETHELYGALMLQFLMERLPVRAWTANRRGY